MKPAERTAPEPPAPPPPPPRRHTAVDAIWDAVTSLKLTIVCLAALMVLVVACTLAQVHLGVFGAVQKYMRAWLVWWDIPRTVLSVPVFPGGALAGFVLGVNLIAAQLRRLELSWKKSGLWIVHLGLILLVAGEFVTGVFQRDDRLAFENGQTTNYVTSFRDVELAVIDTADPTYDDVYSIPGSLLVRQAEVPVPGTPLTVRVKQYFENAQLARLPEGTTPPATEGVGRMAQVQALPPETRDDAVNQAAALVQVRAGGQSLGERGPDAGERTWLVSTAQGFPAQTVTWQGHTYRLEMRERREYLPYALTLKKFSHDVYPGTDIPKNFSSLVRLRDPRSGEDRDVLIRMNQPLRYAGKTFYQASFGKNDTLSILQVVENPGWLLPYIACVLVAIGLLAHFGISLRRWVKRTSGGASRAAEA